MHDDAKRGRVAGAMQVLPDQCQAIAQERVGIGMRPEKSVVRPLGVPDLHCIANRQNSFRNLMPVSTGVRETDDPPRLPDLHAPAFHVFILDPTVDTESTEVKSRPVLLVSRDEHTCVDDLTVSNESIERVFVEIFVMVRDQDCVEPLASGKGCKVLRR
jgi:hypothetical protein